MLPRRKKETPKSLCGVVRGLILQEGEDGSKASSLCLRLGEDEQDGLEKSSNIFDTHEGWEYVGLFP